jgi:hypothetical protein
MNYCTHHDDFQRQSVRSASFTDRRTAAILEIEAAEVQDKPKR